MSIKNWEVLKLNKEKAAFIAEKYNLPPFLAALLDIREAVDSKKIKELLFDDYLQLKNVDFIDMNKAVLRIKEAIGSSQKICVCGDYDADGVTATSLLYSYFESLGANVIYYIPSRENDGYGLNKSIIDKLHAENVDLIVTVDNGITAVDEISYAKSFNIDVVITDHHKVPKVLPDACAIVDPHRNDCTSEFKDFAGVGLAFKLIVAMEGEDLDLDFVIENYIDLVLIGTVGDIVPLKGQNRLFVKLGLEHISRTNSVGLRALLEKARIFGKKLTATNVAFNIVPRINAAGRLSSTEKVVELFTSDNEEKVLAIASELEAENMKRKEIEADILSQAEMILQNEPKRLLEQILIIEGHNWHHGVIGIVAARLLEKYGKPTIVLTKFDGIARGSARSIEGFSIYDAINVCSDYLIKFGGHPMAAGFDIKVENIERLKNDIEAFWGKSEVPFPSLEISCKLNPATLSLDMVEQVKLLEPFGKDNPKPVFGLYDMKLCSIEPVGQGKHLRLKFNRDNQSITAMKFFTTAEEFYYIEGDLLDLAVTLDKSEFNGRESLSVFIEDMKFSQLDNEILLKQKRLYETIKKSEYLDLVSLEKVFPTREDFSYVYKCIKTSRLKVFDVNILYFRLKEYNLDFCKLLLIFDVMAELGLIDLNINGDIYGVKIKGIEKKVDLNSSSILNGLKRV
ncbi:MAG: Single-stranded-DNA-specific exonuclease RecJ [Eubacteriales bacterium SKADARSKE-1]|nr:Single-stranded-DNA-specific exonuclease RecJ [Eubacteriales bacterium SKADARSKE-1]